MEKEGIDYLFVGPGTDMAYICNYGCSPMERLRLFVLPINGKPSFITPAFEAPRFKLGNVDLFFDLLPWEENEDPVDVVEDLVGSAKPEVIAVDDKHWGLFITAYLKKLPKAKFVSGAPVLGELRIRKDKQEIGYLKLLGQALDKIWEELLKIDYRGRTESDLKWEQLEIKKRIYEPPVELSPIGENKPESGINSSSAHGGGPDRVIGRGDVVLWEMGRGACHGYYGDKTRSIQVAPTTEECKKVYEVVKKAQQTAFDAVRPGVTCESIDLAGRKVIEKAGYGQYFTHRIGHGLGLDGHELPYIVKDNKRKLEPGMVFSIEPGIYLLGKWGIRIEDVVYVTEDGAESFYHSTKEFHEAR
jgi:Xaa-Pro aminopeptidase